MNERKYCVYKHTSPDGRIYIGLTKNDPKVRWQGGTGYRGNSYFTRAIKKYGWESFKHEIIAKNLTELEAKTMEIQLIAKFRSNERKFGFNISSGGESKKGTKISAEQKRQIREANIGKIVSQETREKLRQRSLETWKNKDHVSHMREINLGINNPQYGKKLTDKEKLKRGAKQVSQFTISGEHIGNYISIHEASKQTGISRDVISKCCKGMFKQGGGFVWELMM